MKLTIGSRGSKLALTQTNYIKDLILGVYPDWEIDIKIIKTKGDIVLDKEISQIGGKEIFIKEIESQLLDGQIDLAVHSMKDMPGQIHPDLGLSFVPKREDPRDVLILKEARSLSDLPHGARIGTGSKRRAYQLKALRDDLEILGIRGNVETRIEKIYTEGLDGVVLAAAGIHRLNLDIENMAYLDLDEFLPSPGQGILAIEIRKKDQDLNEALMVLNDQTASIQARQERAYLAAVGGSCSVPVGAYLQVDGDKLRLSAILGDEDGNLVSSSLEGRTDEDLGTRLGQILQDKLKERTGKVYLLGAGPGDPELLSLKGKRAIEEADVIVYDWLASPHLLDLNPNAQRIYVGKKAADHTLSQEEINELLVSLAKKHRVVTRLKGGDPYVFGRGGEEALHLRQEGVEFETIPGIPSPIGGLAYAGIPPTHRGMATSFHVITGHTKDNDDLDYESLAKLKGTLIFLMGFSNLDKITQGLVDSGKDPKTPVAVIQWASTPRQQVVEGDLSDIVDQVQNSTIATPAMIVVGEVVGLRKDLNFYENKDLFGKNIVITREEKRARSTIDKLQRLGANVLSFPMIKTVFVDSDDLDQAIQNIKEYDYIYFSSVNGVEYFMEKFLRHADMRDLGSAKFCTIGIKTYKALEKHGIKADLMPDDFEGMEAIEVLKKNVKQDERVLVPRAKLGRNDTVEELKRYCQVDEIAIYDTILTDNSKEEIIEELGSYTDLYYVFTSSSTFTNFHKVLGDDLKDILAKGQIISIGPITSQTIRDGGYEVDKEARVYTVDGIIDILKEDYD